MKLIPHFIDECITKATECCEIVLSGNPNKPLNPFALKCELQTTCLPQKNRYFHQTLLTTRRKAKSSQLYFCLCLPLCVQLTKQNNKKRAVVMNHTTKRNGKLSGFLTLPYRLRYESPDLKYVHIHIFSSLMRDLLQVA